MGSSECTVEFVVVLKHVAVRHKTTASPRDVYLIISDLIVVFAEYTALNNEHKAVNLGQGFPGDPAPDFVLTQATTTTLHSSPL